MGIDGIGKPPAPGGPLGPSGAGGSAPTGGAFKIDKPEAASGVSASDPLAQLGRGEIGVDQYLDAKVSQATTHLEGRLGPEQLEFVKSALREQLRTDPVLMELVRRSTGSLPTGG
jgi:hypothetical protein